MKTLISLLIRFVPRKYLQLFSGVGLKALGIFYMGNKVECPICKNHYRQFLPYGRINPRPNALCPSCLSLERHRLIWLYLQQKTNYFPQCYDVIIANLQDLKYLDWKPIDDDIVNKIVVL
jgi:hypothetical protein